LKQKEKKSVIKLNQPASAGFKIDKIKTGALSHRLLVN